MEIKVKNLSYSYQKGKKGVGEHALKDVSLTISEGEFFGIIGQTGSGKSTFVQHLNGLIKVGKDSGEIYIGDYKLHEKKCDFKSLRAKVGMVFQYPEHQLFAETVFLDVAFGLKNFNKDLSEIEIAERVKEALSIVGLDYEKIKEKSPFELSGGQKRRVAIAGVIVTRPEILVLDEPAAGLDPVGKKEFLSLLKRLHKSFVKTIILVSHDMNVISEYCSKVAIFSHGNLHAIGAPKDIFSNKKDLEELSLSLPTTAYLENALKERGIDIDSDLTVDDFVQKLTTKYKGGM